MPGSNSSRGSSRGFSTWSAPLRPDIMISDAPTVERWVSYVGQLRQAFLFAGKTFPRQERIFSSLEPWVLQGFTGFAHLCLFRDNSRETSKVNGTIQTRNHPKLQTPEVDGSWSGPKPIALNLNIAGAPFFGKTHTASIDSPDLDQFHALRHQGSHSSLTKYTKAKRKETHC